MAWSYRNPKLASEKLGSVLLSSATQNKLLSHVNTNQMFKDTIAHPEPSFLIGKYPQFPWNTNRSSYLCAPFPRSMPPRTSFSQFPLGAMTKIMGSSGVASLSQNERLTTTSEVWGFVSR